MSSKTNRDAWSTHAGEGGIHAHLLALSHLVYFAVLKKKKNPNMHPEPVFLHLGCTWSPAHICV